MKKMLRILIAIIAIITIAMCLTGCQSVWVDIPSGHIGKIITPTGYEKTIREAGQVDIGDLDMEKKGNRLVICEAASSITIKEQFGQAKEGEDSEDHRIITKNKVPLSVDIYVQVGVPNDEKMRNSIFTQVTPVKVDGQERVSLITIQMIYERFAQMIIRGKTREIFSRYKDYDDIMSHYDKINGEISGMIANAFEHSKAPLLLIAGQLSNVKADSTVWAAENRRAAAKAEAAAIDEVGAAIRRNPQYVQIKKWDTLKDIAAKNEKITIIVNDGDSKGVGYTVPVK